MLPHLEVCCWIGEGLSWRMGEREESGSSLSFSAFRQTSPGEVALERALVRNLPEPR